MASRETVRAEEAASARLAQTYLEGNVASLLERGILTTPTTVEGKPYVKIIHFAEDEKIDMIVRSTGGHLGPSRWGLRVASSTESCL
jgi:hypothetical protein